jgi:hypothetical protein
MTETWIDGNGLAGALSDVFCFDVTAAQSVCAACGLHGPFAEVRVYRQAPGVVARCQGCDAVLLRLVRAGDRAWVELRGLRALELTVPLDA